MRFRATLLLRLVLAGTCILVPLCSSVVVVWLRTSPDPKRSVNFADLDKIAWKYCNVDDLSVADNDGIRVWTAS